jgi:hypothetical protein
LRQFIMVGRSDTLAADFVENLEAWH